MIEQALARLTSDDAVNRPPLWSKTECLQTARTTLALLPTVLLWYFWGVMALNGRLGTGNKQDIWLDYLPVHAAIGALLLTGLILVSRFSPRARAANKLGLVAVGLFLCGLIVVAVPMRFNLDVLILLGIAALYYWLTPWRSIRGQWQPMSARPETVMALATQALEKITALPHATLREPVIALLQELLALVDKWGTQRGENGISLTEFCADFSRHCAPLLGALSYRAKALGHDDPALMDFIACFPPFEPNRRIRFNSVAHYRNAVLNNSELDPRVRMLWLKSGLIVADQSPDTPSDTLFDIELMLLPLLLKQPETHQDEIQLLLHRFLQRLDTGNAALNTFQQNAWLEVLQQCAALPASGQLRAAVHDALQRWPGHAPGSRQRRRVRMHCCKP
jgi:hypothetical protein